MDRDIEKQFVKDYIKKNKRERIYYELSSKKKRKKAIGRFCHNALDCVDESKIKYYGTDIKIGVDGLILNREKVGYLISWDDTIDGKMYKPNEAIEKMFNVGMATIVIFSNCCIIKTEQEFGMADMLILQCN